MGQSGRVLFYSGVVALTLLSRAISLCGLEPPSEDSHDTPEAHVGKGYQYEQNERYEEAARQFLAALAVDPRLVGARYQLAICYFALGRRPEARQEFEHVQTETGVEPSVTYYLGRLDLLDGALESAIARLKSVTAAPPFPDAAYYLGSAYLKNNELELAEKSLRTAAELDPHDFRVLDHLARVYQKLGRWEEAEREYAHSEALRQRYNETARQAVDCSRKLETRAADEARATCQQLFDRSDTDKLTTLGMLYGQHGDYADAVEPLALASRLDPDSPEILHNLGLTYFRLKRYAEARRPLERAVALRPDFSGSSALLGATLYALKEDQAAYRVLDHAHQLNPADSDTASLLFETAVLLAQKELATKAYTQSLHHFRKAAELRPADAQVHRQLADVYRLLGQRAQAELEGRAAERLSPH